MSKLFHLIYLKRSCISSKHSEGMQPTIQHPIPFITFQSVIISIPFQYPKSQEKELSCRQSFSSKLVQNITILHIFYQNFSGGGPRTRPPPSIQYKSISPPNVTVKQSQKNKLPTDAWHLTFLFFPLASFPFFA